MSKKRRRKTKRRARVQRAESDARVESPAAKVEPKRADEGEGKGLLARFLFGGISDARPFLLLRGALLLLAFDCWIDLVPHGGRYGIGDFNVAHFSWIDAILPVPSPANYVGTMILTGVLAFAMALRPWRPGIVLLFLSYTYGWTMSMLDSYQHHYLLSLILFSFCFFPLASSEEVVRRSGPLSPAARAGGLAFAFGTYELLAGLCGLSTPLGGLLEDPMRSGVRICLVLFGFLGPILLRAERDGSDAPKNRSAWAYISVSLTCAVVYFYTAVTKLSPDWRDGHALKRIGRSEAIGSLRDEAMAGIGLLPALSEEMFWSLMAKGAIAVQLVSAAGFLLATTQDRKGRHLLPLVALAPLSFHIGAESMGLSIGWFSYYMLAIVVILFGPRSPLEATAVALSEPFSKAARFLEEKLKGARQHVAFGAAAIAVLILLPAIDLPGGSTAAVYLAILLVFAAAIAHRRGREEGLVALAFFMSAVFAYGSLTQTDVRYDYYRFVGGDHRRRGEYAEALEAYEKANRYLLAPYCVRFGGAKIDCYRNEESAEAEAERRGPGHEVRREDRVRQENEMRNRVEQRSPR